MWSMSTPLRVAILGAGPAGVSLAWHLRQIDGLAVDLYDAANEVGGQSVTRVVSGVAIELGTCYLAAGYNIVKEIAEQVGQPAETLPRATMLDAHGQVTNHGSPQASLMAAFIAKWWRWYRDGQMQRPTDPQNALRFDAWLSQHGLSALTSQFSFAAGLTAQLYGPISEVTAHSALTWMRPSLFLTGQLGLTAALPRGFQSLWQAAAARTNATLKLNTAISAVRPDGNRWRLHSAQGSEFGPYDHVFIACPLDSLEHPLSTELRDHYGPFEASRVYSAIWRAENWPQAAESRCYLPSCIENERGRMLTIRRNGGGHGWSVGQLCAYALDGADIEEHRRRMRTDAEEIVGLRNFEFVEDRLWRYNVRYTPQHLTLGLPARLDDAQGEGGLWFTGGTLSHWNVDSITDFNHELAQRFARRIGASLRDRLRLWHFDEFLRNL